MVDKPEIVFMWVKPPNLDWTIGQIGPEPFTVRLIGEDYQFLTRDFEIGPVVEKPTDTQGEFDA